MFFNYVCELKTTSNMAGTMVFGDLLQNCVNQRLFETYNAPEYERIQMLHKLSGLYSEAYENTALFFGKEPVEIRFFGVPGGDEDDFMLNAVTRLEDGRCWNGRCGKRARRTWAHTCGRWRWTATFCGSICRS